MAYKMVTTVTKTDIKPWIFLQNPPEVEPELMARMDAELSALGVGFSTWTYDDNSFTMVKEFATKEECNAWSIRFFRELDVNPYSFTRDYHEGWSEKIEILEI
jgi:hypothetical protein